MSNESLKDRKLKPHQRQIWCKAFEASMRHVSIEAAERKAWQAVDICERIGAFRESQPQQESEYSDATEYKTAFRNLLGWLAKLVPTINPNIHGGSLFNLVNGFDCGDLDPDEFACGLRSLNEASKDIDQADSPIPLLAMYEEAWKRLAIRIGECGETDNDWESRLCKSMNDFALGKLEINDFQENLEEIFPEECD